MRRVPGPPDRWGEIVRSERCPANPYNGGPHMHSVDHMIRSRSDRLTPNFAKSGQTDILFG
eukprot:scaffold456_cov390-Prasinococcus_capsulatus_cf.AAC.2